MFLLNPKQPSLHCPDARSRELVEKTVAFFEAKGKARLREDDLARAWYADFLAFSAREKLFATFLSPAPLGGEGARWDTWRNCALNEVLGFYGLPYWYTWQVSILGLGPIWMSGNEAARARTAKSPPVGRHLRLRPLREGARGRHLLHRHGARPRR